MKAVKAACRAGTGERIASQESQEVIARFKMEADLER